MKDGQEVKKNKARGITVTATGGLKTCAAKDVKKIAGDTLSAHQQQSLAVIVQTLTTYPSRIFLTEKIVQDESYFVEKSVLKSRDWYHKTILTMQGVPKSDLRAVLSKIPGQEKTLTADVLAKVDSFYGLKGLEKLGQYLGWSRRTGPAPRPWTWRR